MACTLADPTVQKSAENNKAFHKMWPCGDAAEEMGKKHSRQVLG